MMRANSASFERSSPVQHQQQTEKQSAESKARDRTGARKALLQWAQTATKQTTGVDVSDFGTSWRDGTAFIAIVNYIKPGTIDADAYRNAPNQVRLEAAFQAADTFLGVAPLLDAEDVDVSKPDDKSIMTYVAQFLHRKPDSASGPSSDQQQREGVGGEMQQYRDFIVWLNSKNSLLEQLQGGKGRNNMDYSDYLRFKEDFITRQRSLEHFRSIMTSPGSGAAQRLPGVTSDAWQQVELSWQKLETQLRHWQWTLDTSLPGQLGQVGEWLNNAEHLLSSDADLPTTFDDEAANALKTKLDEHKHFFAETNAMQLAFERARNSPAASAVSAEQLRDIGQRLATLPDRASQRAARLRFLEHKCCILATIDLTESKLTAWSSRYGTEETIVHMLDQYRAFVSRNKLFHEFDKAFGEMQLVAEEFKRCHQRQQSSETSLSLREVNEIDQFIYSSGERWRALSTGLRCTQGILEEVLAYWRRWNEQCPAMEQWLDSAEPQLLVQDEEERMEFFQHIGTWKEKYDQLNEVAAFLATTCEPNAAKTVRNRFENVVRRWEQLFDRVKHYMHAGEILRHRRAYRQGCETLEKWIIRANQVLASVPVGSLEAMKEYGDELHQLYAAVDENEQLLKQMSRHFQSLVPELNAEEIQAINSSIKRQKETLVRIRSLIASRFQQFHQLQTQRESLELGINEVAQWLAEARRFITEVLEALDADLEGTQSGLERHQAFFSRLVSYKLLLDDKWKVFESIVRASPVMTGAENGAAAAAEQEAIRSHLQQLSTDFDQISQESQQWENRLMDGVHRWRNYQEALRLATQWLQRAEALMAAEKNVNGQQALENHATFFDTSDERIMHQLETAAGQLQDWLPDEVGRSATITDVVEMTLENWRRLSGQAPLQRLKLEFRLDEEAFGRASRDVERQLALEQQALSHPNANTDQLLKQHLSWFGVPAGPAVSQAQALIERLEQTAVCIPNVQEVQQAYERARMHWNTLMQRSESLLDQLQAIPQKWAEYVERFDEMTQWMDSVDQSLEGVLDDAGSLDQFECVRDQFQLVCSHVDTRRENMKWLVQRLDSMLAYKTEEEGNIAQHQLEELIARYKNLVTLIESTAGKTDLLTKCYSCREEIVRVCSTLDNFQHQQQQQKHDGMGYGEETDLSALEAETAKQEALVSQLDAQRSTVVSLLQRGRDLQHHPNAPGFLPSQVQRLEITWNKTNEFATDKLKKMKGNIIFHIISYFQILIYLF